MRGLAFALILFSTCFAATAPPRIYEQDDLGDPMFKEFVYAISVDCTASAIKLYVMDEDYEPVQDAGSLLKYVDFSSPLLSSVETDKDGFALHKLPGQTTLMRGLFILVMEKDGFRSKEVHFDISPCYTDYTFPQPPPAQKPPVQNTSGTTVEVIVPDPTETGNGSVPETPATGEEDTGEKLAGICAIPALLLMFIITTRP